MDIDADACVTVEYLKPICGSEVRETVQGEKESVGVRRFRQWTTKMGLERIIIEACFMR